MSEEAVKVGTCKIIHGEVNRRLDGHDKAIEKNTDEIQDIKVYIARSTDILDELKAQGKPPELKFWQTKPFEIIVVTLAWIAVILVISAVAHDLVGKIPIPVIKP